MTTPFYRRSSWLVGGLMVVAVAGLVTTRWLAHAVTATTAAMTEQQAKARLESLTRSFSAAEQTALAATVPTEADLAIVYPSFEALAARHGVTIRYDFSTTPEQDATLVQAEAARDSWVIPIDFLGARPALETILEELETGPYLVKVHSYRFDVTDEIESVLSTTLILYGR